MATKKKPVKKTVAAASRPAPKAPVNKPKIDKEQMDCKCTCRSHHECFKRFLTFVFGAIVGAAVCCGMHCDGRYGKFLGRKFMGPKMEFVNGCLDTSRFECAERVEQMQLKDANKDGCITKEEMMAARPAMDQKADMPMPARKHMRMRK